jgi:hypothetical protein
MERSLWRFPRAQGRLLPSYRRAANTRKKKPDTFVEWNKRGYLWKKVHNGWKELPEALRKVRELWNTRENVD